MKYFTSLLFIFISNIVIAQTLDLSITFGGNDFDEGICIKQTDDEGFIIAGNTYSFGAGSSDFWLLRLDENYDTIWTETYGRNDIDLIQSICETYDQSIIIAGQTKSIYGDYDAWILKLNESGNIIWNNTYGGNEYNSAISVQQTTDSAFIVAGLKDSLEVGILSMWLLKLNESGDTIWTKSYEGTPYSIQQTLEGGYIVAGMKKISTLVYNAFILKLDQNGDTVWTKTISDNDFSRAYSVQQTNDNGYIIAGEIEVSEYNTDMWILKLDTNGDKEWERNFEDTLVGEVAYSICQTYDNGYIVGGTKYSGIGKKNGKTKEKYNINDLMILKLDQNGDKEWEFILDNSDRDEVNSILQLTNGNYIATGTTNNDLWIITIIENQNGLPTTPTIESFSISQNYPNPFSLETNINYSIPEDYNEWVVIKLYNSNGCIVKELLNRKHSGGNYCLSFNASLLPSGIYFYKIITNSYIKTNKMILMK